MRSGRRHWRALVAGAAVVAAVLVGLVVTRRTDGDARVLSSSAPHPGWILHVRRVARAVPYAGAGHYASYRWDTYYETKPPFRTRTVGSTWIGAPGAHLEEERSQVGAAVYDPATEAIYAQSGNVSGSDGFEDPAAANRERVKSGEWRVAARVTIDGRRLLKLKPTVPGSTSYLDPDTYVLVRLESTGMPLHQRGNRKVRSWCAPFDGGPRYPSSTSVVTTEVYEYLPPTKANERLTSIEASHRAAGKRPAGALPRPVKQALNPPTCRGVQK